ncbi:MULTISPECIES: hypothetical protein [unclassified Sphingomonas]|uniref:hypothetical protein n=1 Tax=unclassified Sphingomonas TaxID=196159 RepID=UPI0006F2E663|nr:MULTISPECIES: hypothetical protein [unclassified Sphingomonas]KQM23942.1 hypothetical protein ASE58_16840 [Sphingomonas sp. Leaf9]KQM42071.1 hypothetical protein ASE57_16845 [Sphingomonas sp. Leaf11]
MVRTTSTPTSATFDREYDPASVAERGEIVAIPFSVVAFSIFAQGLTMPQLLCRRNLTEAAGTEHCDGSKRNRRGSPML